MMTSRRKKEVSFEKVRDNSDEIGYKGRTESAELLKRWK